MALTPKFEKDYLAELAGYFVTFFGAADLNENSVELLLLKTLAKARARDNKRLRDFDRSHGLDARGSMLTDRVRQIMNGVLPRGSPTAAFGGQALRFTRGDATIAKTFAAGQVVTRSDDPDTEYVTTESFDMGVGEFVFPPVGFEADAVACRCLKTGPRGNAIAAGTIDTLVRRGATDAELTSVTNIGGVGGGLPTEEDPSYEARARLLIASIARVQPAALEFLAERFVDSEQRAIKFGKVYRDIASPCFAELVVDDGYGLAGFTQPAQTTSGVVGVGGTQGPLFFENPAATEPKVRLNGGDWVPFTLVPGATVIHEEGVVEFLPGTGLAEGTTWEIGLHQVYTGPVRELQRAVHGIISDTVSDWGYRATPNRIRVRPAITQPISLRLQLETQPGVVRAAGENLVRDIAREYIASVRPGGRFVRFDLYAQARRYSSVVKNLVVELPTEDISPSSGRHRFVAQGSDITFGAS